MAMKSAEEAVRRLEGLVLAVHRRHGGVLDAVPWEAPLLGGPVGLDSLDLAEVMVAVERELGVEPFAVADPPRTWAEVRAVVEGRWRQEGGE